MLSFGNLFSSENISPKRLIIIFLIISTFTGLLFALSYWFFVKSGKFDTQTEPTIIYRTIEKEATTSAKQATYSSGKKISPSFEESVLIDGSYTNYDLGFSVKFPRGRYAEEWDYLSSQVPPGDQPTFIWYTFDHAPQKKPGAPKDMEKNEYGIYINYYKPSKGLQKFIDNTITQYKAKTYGKEPRKIDENKKYVEGQYRDTLYMVLDASYEWAPQAEIWVFVKKGENELFEIHGKTRNDSDLGKFQTRFNNFLASFKFLD